MKTPEKIKQLIGEIMDEFPQVEIEFEPLPSGVCWINVWYGRRNFEMEYSPSGKTGVSENFDDTPPFIGHDAAFELLDKAVEHFKSLLADAEKTEADHLPQAFVMHDKKN
jgi:hypothetical protein